MASSKRSDGEGSTYQRHLDTCPPAVDGKRPAHTCKGPWVGVIVVGWNNGKPVRRKVTAASRAGANTKLRELRDKVNAGTLPAGRVPTVGEWLTHWLDEIAARKIRPSTLRGYRTYVGQYLIPLLGQHRLDRLTPEHVEAAWVRLQEIGRPGVADPRPLSSTSALQAHRILARAIKVAQQRGLVQRNVVTLLDAPSRDDVEMTPLSVAEARRVLAAAADDRMAARWSVALALGLRQGEALGLTWDRVNLDEGVIVVRQALGRVKDKGLVLGPVKSRAGERTVVMPVELLTQLKAHRLAQNAEKLAAGSFWDGRDFVFATVEGQPFDARADWQAWKNLLTKAGVNEVRLHDARHTAATLLLAQGIAPRVVMGILGHSQISVTMKYQHVVDEMQKDAAKAMSSALWG